MESKSIPGSRIFVCTHQKDGAVAQCLAGEGEKCATWIKEEIKNRNLKGKVWASRTRCLGYCDPKGTSVIYVRDGQMKQFSAVVFEEFVATTEEFLKSSR